jgi:hypothetical protein
VHQPGATAVVPVHPDLQRIRGRGDRDPRRRAGQLAGVAAAASLPPVPRGRARPGAAARCPNGRTFPFVPARPAGCPGVVEC